MDWIDRAKQRGISAAEQESQKQKDEKQILHDRVEAFGQTIVHILTPLISDLQNAGYEITFENEHMTYSIYVKSTCVIMCPLPPEPNVLAPNPEISVRLLKELPTHYRIGMWRLGTHEGDARILAGVQACVADIIENSTKYNHAHKT